MNDLISRQAAIELWDKYHPYIAIEAMEYDRELRALPSAQPERKKDEWTTHEVACLLAEVTGDECACNVNGNDEWLPFVCEFAETTCPDVVGVACWEQWLVHRKEKNDGSTNT